MKKEHTVFGGRHRGWQWWLVLLLPILCSVTAQAQSYGFRSVEQPKYEVRAAWLATIGGIDWPRSYCNGTAAAVARQKQELTTMLDQLKAAGINVVLLQTRVRATTIYPSALEPWDGSLSGTPGKSPGYDALQFAIDECHRRGMQLHAWVVTIPVGKWTAAGCTHLRKRYPRLVKKIGQDGYMDPESAETGRYLADICEEIVGRYDVDGIHLDYIRYPETWKLKVSRQQGRRHITAIATAISRRVKSLKPWVMMSCSPIGKADDLSRYSSRGWNARTVVCQDAQEWLRTGVMDALFPMMYFRDNHFYPFAIDWKEQSHGKIVAPGVATYMLDRHEGNWPLPTLTQELNVLRMLELGHTHFRSKFLVDNVKGVYSFEQQLNRFPALVPPMTWLSQTLPPAPTGFQLRRARGGIELSWSGSADLLYNVYASRTCPVDVSDARNLVATRLSECSLSVLSDVRHAASLFYAVTALDRYGNESQALQSHVSGAGVSGSRGLGTDGGRGSKASLPMLSCDGRQLELPERPVGLDADMLSIETLQGTPVVVVPYRGRTADVSRLAEGAYQVKSLDRKGKPHRLGFFMLRRWGR